LPYDSVFKIKNFECRNHLFRNYYTKLIALSKQIDYPIVVRKYITLNILRFRSDITKVIENHMKNNWPVQQQIESTEQFGIFNNTSTIP